MKVVALAFALANQEKLSACSLGISIYEDGVFVDNYAFLLLPPINYRHFSQTYLHGISYEDVKDEKEFNDIYDKLEVIFKDALLISHNIKYQIDILNALCDYYGLDHFKNKYFDTVALMRLIYPSLDNHRLSTINEYLELDLELKTAKDIAEASLSILITTMSKFNYFDINEFLKATQMKIFINT